MKLQKVVIIIALSLTLILAACSGTNATAPVETPAVEAAAPGLLPIVVTNVNVAIGVGSPIPVDAVVSGEWPGLCAQLAEITQTFNGSRFQASLLAMPGKPDCPPDNVGLPFRIALPLNMVELPAGTYQVAVNGVETSFDWGAPAPESPVATPGATSQAGSYSVAFIGPDGNVWLLERGSGALRQVTQDAVLPQPGSAEAVETIAYSEPQLSSDGLLLAFGGEIGRPVESGYEYQNNLWIFDTVLGTTRPALESQRNLGYDWKPGGHLLAYALAPDDNYFSQRGKTDASLAVGIMGFDADQNQSSTLVEPVRGFSLLAPQWSPDGRFLSFDELVAMEGRGYFGYYNFEEQAYVPASEAIGSYSWSPDGAQIAYDRLTYVANGGERVVINQRQGGQEQPFAPEFPGGYSFAPVFSPQGDRIAYLANLGGADIAQYTLFVQNLDGSEPVNLGVYEQAWFLAWSPDGSRLVLSAGPYEAQQINEVDPATGQAVVLTQGSQPGLTTP